MSIVIGRRRGILVGMMFRARAGAGLSLLSACWAATHACTWGHQKRE